jgi:hypothetical protein
MGMGGLRQRGGQRPAAPTISGPQTDDVRWIQKNALPALTQNPVEFKQVRDAAGVVWRRSGSTDRLSHPFDGCPVLNVQLSHDDSSLRIQCFPLN